MAVVNKFNVNKQQVTLDSDIIENMSANDVSYNSSLQYGENTVGDKLSELEKEVIYDVTSNNDGETFASLSELLSSETLSTLIPSTVRCGGMTIRFVQSSDNKYVQYRLMKNIWSTTETDWQGVDDEPFHGSQNMVKGTGISKINENIGHYKGIYSGGAIIFTKDDVPAGNIISVKLILTTSAGSIRIFDENGNMLEAFNVQNQSVGYEKTFDDYTLPNNYSYIQHIVGYSPSIVVDITVKTMTNLSLFKSINVLSGIPGDINTLSNNLNKNIDVLKNEISNINNILEDLNLEDIIKIINIGGVSLEVSNNTVTLPEASKFSSGLMSASDKTKLDEMSGDITIEGSGVYKNANAYGFLPTNDADTNSINLQNCLNGGGTIHIDIPGTYELNHSIYLDDNTELIFGAGVVISKVSYNGIFPRVVFTNRNSLQRTWNENITIRNLHLQTNGYGAGNSDTAPNAYGIRSQIAFFYVKNLVIDGYYSTDNSSQAYNIQICTFENIRLENIYIISAKDGIHLGPGKNFVIRNYKARTKDDILAFNADDYPGSNPESGWIENGLIDNLTVLPNDTLIPISGTDENIKYDTIKMSGRFLMIGGAWKEWESGMIFKSNGDCVLSDGKIYVTNGGVTNVTDIVSTQQPTHNTFTDVTYSDGITWRLRQNVDPITSCSVKNITFKNINVLGAFYSSKIYLESTNYRRSYYPDSVMAKAQDITFENVNIYVSNQPNLVQIYHKVENLKVINCNLRNISECIEFNNSSSGSYPTDNKVSILLSGNYYDFIGNKYLYTVNGSNFSGRMKICSSMVKEGNLVKKNDPNNSITLLDDDVF